MKFVFSFCFILCALYGRSQYQDVMPGVTKERDRVLITNKMDELKTRVELELGCKVDTLKFTVVDKYIQYSKPKKTNMNPPKTIVVEACEQRLTYINVAVSGYIYYWAEGTWTLDAASKK